ncbi:hypothetical protein OS493_035021 [Desmophyllum pertusum]|uniref:Lipoxygenase domain-containing protein n=1 Tax=Desmophyllum pertusum TaxID=174260 RepID=A0A9W9Y7Q7_9CNID|nr:hypothetical protein OS493_035021 [Desmophyllum pertusum]
MLIVIPSLLVSSRYYECDDDVENDYELQNFMNEVSADGTGSDGGLGNIKDLPNEITSVNSLVIFLTRFLWHISAHHAAINYPLTDYGGFTLNMPTKLYRDSRVSDDVFSLFNFPNANISAEHGLIGMSLSNYRFDSLFDYGSQLPDKPGREVISKWYNYLQRKVQPYIEKRNKDRLEKGHLTYPYLLPRWVPNGIYGNECPVELAQKTSAACQQKRYQQLLANQQLYQLAPFIKGEPIRLLNMTIEKQLTVFSKHPFEMWEFNIYLTKTRAVKVIFDQWTKLNAGEDIQSFADFVKIYAFFRKAQAAFGDPYFKYPSDEEPFQDVIKYSWRDEVFAEQRLAGANPMTLMRVTTDRDNVGIKWSHLNNVLNQKFDWDNLIINTPKMPNISLTKAINCRMVFVLRYPLLDYLPAMPDIMESRPHRKMWDPTSPIAFFAVHPCNRTNLRSGRKSGLQPSCGTLAKDPSSLEPFCVSKDRQLSERHPLHQIIKYHCRGISITDKLAFKLLLAENESFHKTLPYGYLGGLSMALRSYRQTSWKDTDFLANIKKRGLEPRSLHYFPYRDDGYILYNTIQKVVKEYVKQYVR